MAILARPGRLGPVTGMVHRAWICQKSAETVGEPFQKDWMVNKLLTDLPKI